MREWKKPIVNELSVELTLCWDESGGGGGYAIPCPCDYCWLKNSCWCPGTRRCGAYQLWLKTQG